MAFTRRLYAGRERCMKRSGDVKSSVWLATLIVLASASLHAQPAQTLARSSSVVPPPGSALPPPGLNDPGAVPLPSTGIAPSVAPAARDGGRDSTNVTTHTDANGDVIEEHRSGGSVTSVKVKPKHGVTQTYRSNNPDGSLVHDPRTGAVAPVYYDIYDWGKPKKPASSATPPASSG